MSAMTTYKEQIINLNNKVDAELKAMNWQSRAFNKFNMLRSIVEFAVLNHPNTQYHFDKDVSMPIYELRLTARVDVGKFGTIDRLVCSYKGSYLSVGNSHGFARLKDVCSGRELDEIIANLMDEATRV